MAEPDTNGAFNPLDPQAHQADLSASGITIPSDSENYSSATTNHDLSSSPSPPPSSSESPVIVYKPPTIWGLLRGAAINLVLPFINGLMLGFGELLAHEAAFRLGWGGTKVFPPHRSSHTVGPGVEMREDPLERRRRNDSELLDTTALE
ncbi:MAG: hypothetical protein Q9227_004735 [Pyrenula ochraceoflavens]